MSAVEPLLAGTPADAVLNALPHPVIVVAADGKVVDANAAAYGTFGSMRDVVGASGGV